MKNYGEDKAWKLKGMRRRVGLDEVDAFIGAGQTYRWFLTMTLGKPHFGHWAETGEPMDVLMDDDDLATAVTQHLLEQGVDVFESGLGAPRRPLVAAPDVVERALVRFGMPAAPDSLPLIRAALETEVTRERNEQGRGNTSLMRLYCALLFTAGQAEDARLIWHAKQASFDASAAIDVQLLCGAGLVETVDALESSGLTDAGGYLSACLDAGDFDGFAPERYGAWLRSFYDDEA